MEHDAQPALVTVATPPDGTLSSVDARVVTSRNSAAPDAGNDAAAVAHAVHADDHAEQHEHHGIAQDVDSELRYAARPAPQALPPAAGDAGGAEEVEAAVDSDAGAYDTAMGEGVNSLRIPTHRSATTARVEVATGSAPYAAAIAAAVAGRFTFDPAAAAAVHLRALVAAEAAPPSTAARASRASRRSEGVHALGPHAARAASAAHAPPERPWSSSTPLPLSGLGAPGQLRAFSILDDAAGAPSSPRALQEERSNELLQGMLAGAPSTAAQLACRAAPVQSETGIHADNFTRTLRNGRPLGASGDRPAWPRALGVNFAPGDDDAVLQRTAARTVYRLQEKHRQHEAEASHALAAARSAAGVKRADVLNRPLSRFTDELDAGTKLLAEVSESVLDKEDERRRNRLRALHHVWSNAVYTRVRDELQAAASQPAASSTSGRYGSTLRTHVLATTKAALNDADPTRLPLTRTQREMAVVGETSHTRHLQALGATMRANGSYSMPAPLGMTIAAPGPHTLEASHALLLPQPAPLPQQVHIGATAVPPRDELAGSSGSPVRTPLMASGDAVRDYIGLDDLTTPSTALTGSMYSDAGLDQPPRSSSRTSAPRAVIAHVANTALKAAAHAPVATPALASHTVRSGGVAPSPVEIEAARRANAGSTPFHSGRPTAADADGSPTPGMAQLSDSMRRISIFTASSSFFDPPSARTSPARAAPVATSGGHGAADATLRVSPTGVPHAAASLAARAPPAAQHGIATYTASAPISDRTRVHASGSTLLYDPPGSRSLLKPTVWSTGVIEHTTFVRDWPLVGEGLIARDHPLAREFATSGEAAVTAARQKLVARPEEVLQGSALAAVLLQELEGYGPGYKGKKKGPAPKASPDAFSVVRKHGFANDTLAARMAASASEMRDIMAARIVPLPPARRAVRAVDAHSGGDQVQGVLSPPPVPASAVPL